VDPNYRVGYAQTWNVKMQRDLPGSLQALVTYLGIKGTRGGQLFLPNTNPAGALNPCPSCPVGFEYLTSNGNSTRESGQIQLRRRLHSGFAAALLYTYSKSIDDDSALGGQGAVTQSTTTSQQGTVTQTVVAAAPPTIAQDWRNLRGERGLSTFDQRHLVNVVVQYTTGMGMAGGTLLTGWRGRLYKEWTVQTQISAGSGLPETPIDSSLTVAGYSAFVRPNVTGAPLYAAPAGLFLNPAAYAAPAAGQWGNARRGGITGPNQFSLNAAMVRTFRLDAKVNLDMQIAATNAFNHVSYTSWIPNINSTQFGLPAAANPMRSVQTSLRLRF
jgi:trimeric autotransporter adhesin